MQFRLEMIADGLIRRPAEVAAPLFGKLTRSPAFHKSRASMNANLLENFGQPANSPHERWATSLGPLEFY
ncbi:MAG: hypothetical protein CMJ78_10690 [Planctomycetaceae bacterium]|nr:hypothetical protein [Planctomycetaceae bacterium]